MVTVKDIDFRYAHGFQFKWVKLVFIVELGFFP